MTRVALPIVLLLMAMSLVFGWAPAMAAQTAPKILRVWWSDEISQDLEPQSNENGTSDLTLLVYEGLTRYRRGAATSSRPRPSRGSSTTTATPITFHLRDNLTYSDGSPLTAERFRYAIARQCDPHLDLLRGRASSSTSPAARSST